MGPIDSLGGRGTAARLAMAAVLWPLLLPAGAGAAGTYVHWVAENGGISRPLAGKRGDPRRGLALVVDSHKGNCLACHHLPIAGEAFQGDLGPSLHGVAARLTEAQIRLRVVDEKRVNPDTVMPGYYRDPRQFNRVAPGLEGRTLFTPQEIEDVVAYLMTLKGE